jgi:hypothetical protein
MRWIAAHAGAAFNRHILSGGERDADKAQAEAEAFDNPAVLG